VSFDALNERRLRETIPAAAVPALRSLFDAGACADHAVPAWPSKTAASHASLWTGAYGDVNGIAANTQPPLPRARHAITERVSGYAAAQLRAEPLWITAALAGRRVVAHQPTQAPGLPGYEPERTDAGRDARSALARPELIALNGYNRHYAPDLAITERGSRPHAAAGWANLDALGSGVEPREVTWAVGSDSVFALLHGHTSYTHVLVAWSRDASRGVGTRVAPAERGPVGERPLARHFSDPLPKDLPGGRVYLRVRLFALSPDGSRFLIFQPALSVVESNHPEQAVRYGDAIGGWVGNGAQDLLRDGGLGPTLPSGGDGEAELRYLESLELVTRQFMRGAAWAWARNPDLMLDYFPMADETDHMWFGFVAPESPAYRAGLASAIQGMRARAWDLVDRRFAGLRRLVEGDSGAVLFVSGDHGMRPTWRVFRPNVALAEAGLLAADDAGRAEPRRTRAYSPDGLYVMVNTTDWKDGIVPPDSVDIVIASAERALRAVQGADGAPVVTRTWRVTGTDSLGRGGPVGGQLYYETRDGYAWTRGLDGPAAGPGRIGADHGYPSISPDMYTVLCAAGDAVGSRRIGPARTIDAAPTVSDWLRIPAPRDSRGRSLLGGMTE